jgi:hypothetical protein
VCENLIDWKIETKFDVLSAEGNWRDLKIDFNLNYEDFLSIFFTAYFTTTNHWPLNHLYSKIDFN